MPKPIDADLVKARLQNFRGDWDWEKSPVLRLPLHRHSSTEDIPSRTPVRPVAPDHAVYHRETGHIDGVPAERIVGTVPGTDLFVVVEEYVRRR